MHVQSLHKGKHTHDMNDGTGNVSIWYGHQLGCGEPLMQSYLKSCFAECSAIHPAV